MYLEAHPHIELTGVYEDSIFIYFHFVCWTFYLGNRTLETLSQRQRKSRPSGCCNRPSRCHWAFQLTCGSSWRSRKWIQLEYDLFLFSFFGESLYFLRSHVSFQGVYTIKVRFATLKKKVYF